jgi:cardiolipin synthase
MGFLLWILATLFITIVVVNLKSPGKRIEHRINAEGTLDSMTVKRSLGQLLGPPLTSGNSVQALHNGDRIFPSMLEAIASAHQSITFETYIYWSGEIGKKFTEAFKERARAGVRVHILMDWIGCQRIARSTLEELVEAGAQVELYRPVRWYNLTRINNRTHRKILVIDGKIGFTGGVGIADQWLGNAQDAKHWRESHFRIEGPVVGQLQAAFMDNWNVMNDDVLHGNAYFPEIPECGSSLAQVFKSSPEEGSGSVRLMYLYAIAHASRTIQIANAYFVPDSHLRKVLIKAAKKGIVVEVIVPGPITDVAISRRASRAVWGDMLAAGIRIYEYQPTMFHCKYMIVDGLWISVGSTNLDNRSFRLNDECNLNVIDATWAEEMSLKFAQDRARSKEMTYEMWKKRPLPGRAVEWLSSWLQSQI